MTSPINPSFFQRSEVSCSPSPGGPGVYDFLVDFNHLMNSPSGPGPTPVPDHWVLVASNVMLPLIGQLLGAVGITSDNNKALYNFEVAVNNQNPEGIREAIQALVTNPSPKVLRAFTEPLSPSQWLPIVQNFFSHMQESRNWEILDPPPPPFDPQRVQDEALSLDYGVRQCMVPCLMTFIQDNDPDQSCEPLSQAIEGLISYSGDPPPGDGNPLYNYYNLPTPYTPPGGNPYPPDYWEIDVAYAFQAVSDAIKQLI